MKSLNTLFGRIGIICPSEIAFRRFLPALKEAGCFEFAGVAIASKEEFLGATDEVLKKERDKAMSFINAFGGELYEGYNSMIHSEDVDAIYLPLIIFAVRLSFDSFVYF